MKKRKNKTVQPECSETVEFSSSSDDEWSFRVIVDNNMETTYKT